METFDVIVVGAGPAGLLFAGDIAAAGFRVVVFEKHRQINSFSRASRITPRSLEVFAARGLAGSIIDQGNLLSLNGEGGIFNNNLGAFRSPFSTFLSIPQPLVDAELERYALDCGAQIFRGHSVIDVQSNHTPIIVTVECSPQENQEYQARFVVAADGANSTVRSVLGIKFPGKRVFSNASLADVVLDPACITAKMSHTPIMAKTKNAYTLIIPYGHDDKFRIMTWEKDPLETTSFKVDQAEIERIVHACVDNEIIIAEFIATSRFSSDERQIAEYRHGNVFFIGDAAHCHSPAGGQGLNTGVQDAANLSWKLALVLAGSSDNIVDTYQAERHPIGRKAIKLSGLLLRGNITQPKLWKSIFSCLQRLYSHLPQLQKFFVGNLSGLGLHYSHTNLSGNKHHLIGSRAMVDTEDGSIFDLLNGRSFILVLNKRASPNSDLVQKMKRFSALCRLTYHKDTVDSLLVRPDGYIVAVGDADWQRELELWLPQSHELFMPTR